MHAYLRKLLDHQPVESGLSISPVGNEHLQQPIETLRVIELRHVTELVGYGVLDARERCLDQVRIQAGCAARQSLSGEGCVVERKVQPQPRPH